MAVIRINKTENYTVMSNTHFKEKGMSYKAKGLLSVMLSLPDNWDYSVAGLETLSRDGKASIKKALAELEQFGYLKRTQTTDDKGRFSGYEYDIYEKPLAENPSTEKPSTEKPFTGNPSTENQPQLNTNRSITNKSITNVSNTDIPPATGKRFKAPTLEDVKAYCQERKNNIDPERFIDYYTAKGWKIGKNPMKDWKAAVRTWEKNKFDKPAQETPQEANPGFDEWMNNFMSQKEGN